MTSKQIKRITELCDLLGVEIISYGLGSGGYNYEINQYDGYYNAPDDYDFSKEKEDLDSGKVNRDEQGELYHKAQIKEYPLEYEELLYFCNYGDRGYLQ